MEFVVVFLATLSAAFVLVTQRKRSIREKGVKKQQIIQNYKDELATIIERCGDDKQMLKEQKVLFIKKANDELARNIFFTQEEAHKLVEELSKA